MSKIDIYLEIGQKRTFAGAMQWPGWCRSGRDEESALQGLLAYGPRYARVLEGTSLGFQAPADVSAFEVAERLKGNATTDFGAPDGSPSVDRDTFGEQDFQQSKILLEACWLALDKAVKKAQGKELRKGPRGGGREAEEIVRHVLDSDASYVSTMGGRSPKRVNNSLEAETRQIRQAILEALETAARVGIPPKGPRGGTRWTPRYFVRRSAWHVLDHVWEIEDRM